MKTNVADTSLHSYFGEVIYKMGDKQKQVLECLMFHGAMTNSEIAKKLGWAINTVTPRNVELRERKLIEEAGIATCSVTGRAAKLWKVVWKQPKEEKVVHQAELPLQVDQNRVMHWTS